MASFYVLEHTYDDGWREVSLNPEYFRSLDNAKKALEKLINEGEVVKRWNDPDRNILDFVQIKGEYPDEYDFYEIKEIKFKD